MPAMDVISGIRDNHKRGKVGDFLQEKIQSGAKFSFVSAYFTIYAYARGGGGKALGHIAISN